MYAIRSYYAGNREALSLFGGYRKKWAGLNGAPSSQFFSSHVPLPNDNVAVGFSLFNSSVSVVNQSGASFSYAYRLKMDKNTKLAFALSAGADFYALNWTQVNTLDETHIDPEFASNETGINPILGFGSALYSHQFFLGFSIPNFFFFDTYGQKEGTFNIGKANYLLNAGYMYEISELWKVQPSALVAMNFDDATNFEMSATVVYNDQIWIGGSYRTTQDAVALLGYQINPQLRFTYSFDFTMTEVSSYNSGTHELSLQFDFGYKLPSSNPKFF